MRAWNPPNEAQAPSRGGIFTAYSPVKGRLMKLRTKAAVLVSGLVLVVAPAVALAAKPPAPGAPTAAARRYHASGRADGCCCKAESKWRGAGGPGTASSKCGTGMAKRASGTTSSPKAACATESKKHVAG